MIQTILVPQGAEYRAVCRGLRGIADPPTVFPTPAGAAIAPYLRSLHQAGCLFQGQRLVLMGLCGSLTPRLTVGDAVLYDESLSTNAYPCDRPLTAHLQTLLNVPIVRGVTSDRVISTAIEKQQLAAQFKADAVDMEGAFALEVLSEIGVAVATVRVVSDDCDRDLPNVSHAFSADGSLQPLALSLAMVRQPIAALRLIRGSLHGLKALQAVTQKILEENLSAL